MSSSKCESTKLTQYLPKRKNESETLYQRALQVVIEDFNSFCSKASASLHTGLFFKILESLPVEAVDYCIGSEFIHCENFYKRASMNTFGSGKCIVDCHGLCWKRLFCERTLEELLVAKDASLSSDNDSNKELLKIVKASQDYVFTLGIELHIVNELLVSIIENLPNLTSFLLRNNKIDVTQDKEKMNFHIGHFGKALQCTSCLCSLSLSNCNLHDDLLRLFFHELNGNDAHGGIRNTLICLDISHNRITSNGLNLVIDYFLKVDKDDHNKNEKVDEPILAKLNIAGNDIKSDGGNCLGLVLATNCSLVELDISLNRLADEGGKSLFTGLEKNVTLRSLSVASNSLASQSIFSLSKAVAANQLLTESTQNFTCSLEVIDLSSNHFSGADIIKLAKAIQQNDRLVSLDLRNQINEANLKTFESSIDIINKKLMRNKQARG